MYARVQATTEKQKSVIPFIFWIKQGAALHSAKVQFWGGKMVKMNAWNCMHIEFKMLIMHNISLQQLVLVMHNMSMQQLVFKQGIKH